ncbi:DNA-binding NarL/FixJ family response regulator [Nocardioides massiliensis]|uniref:DNA-binding NarL/FixJ family response regulator n=2 Tax=Nocardioides massiliensis TaxID=1325935 RepID=A0ABT9NNR7_9ACTN|nr:response regulator transcription factor [Nocardioides massiliensis]MDP9822071.1 DNA-binding NarL/FixJ family response regulator [Nocardioides massiliensis]
MIRVCIADDQTIVRQGIESLLALSDEVEVVGRASDGDEALTVVETAGPDVLLLDLRMPGRDGIATLEALREAGSSVAVLVLTTFDDDELVLRALRAGARGYLLKDVTLEELVEAIRVLAAGGTLVQPALTDRLLRHIDAEPLPDGFSHLPTPQSLTSRETEILRLLASGFTNREVAEALFLAEGTVKNHISTVLAKLGVKDRTRAVLRALHLGLLTPPRP